MARPSDVDGSRICLRCDCRSSSVLCAELLVVAFAISAPWRRLISELAAGSEIKDHRECVGLSQTPNWRLAQLGLADLCAYREFLTVHPPSGRISMRYAISRSRAFTVIAARLTPSSASYCRSLRRRPAPEAWLRVALHSHARMAVALPVHDQFQAVADDVDNDLDMTARMIFLRVSGVGPDRYRVGVDRKLCPGRAQTGATAHDRDARGGQRIALPDRLSVAAAAQGVSAVLDGSAVFLPVAGSGGCDKRWPRRAKRIKLGHYQRSGGGRGGPKACGRPASFHRRR